MVAYYIWSKSLSNTIYRYQIRIISYPLKVIRYYLTNKLFSHKDHYQNIINTICGNNVIVVSRTPESILCGNDLTNRIIKRNKITMNKIKK